MKFGDDELEKEIKNLNNLIVEQIAFFLKMSAFRAE